MAARLLGSLYRELVDDLGSIYLDDIARLRMTNLDRWTPLAQNVMSELALGDDPQRLVVIATALAGAHKVAFEEVVFMLQGMQTDAINRVDRGNVIDRVRSLALPTLTAPTFESAEVQEQFAASENICKHGRAWGMCSACNDIERP